MANLILGLISALVAFTSLDTLVAQALAAEGLDVSVDEDVLRSAVIAGYVIVLVFAALQAMFIWFAWQGRNWARIVLWILGGLSVVSGLASLGTATAPSTGFLTALSWFGFALALAGIVLLAQKPANEWYRYRGWLRATGQGR
jgi:predicted membrane channel-forming protein YqfA (hemolysin III family)